MVNKKGYSDNGLLNCELDIRVVYVANINALSS